MTWTGGRLESMGALVATVEKAMQEWPNDNDELHNRIEDAIDAYRESKERS